MIVWWTTEEYSIQDLLAHGGGYSVISDVLATLEPRRNRESGRKGTKQKQRKGKGRMVKEDELPEGLYSLVTHLHPADCPNLTSAMKSLVSAFVDKQEEEEEEEQALLINRASSIGATQSIQFTYFSQFPVPQGGKRQLLWPFLT